MDTVTGLAAKWTDMQKRYKKIRKDNDRYDAFRKFLGSVESPSRPHSRLDLEEITKNNSVQEGKKILNHISNWVDVTEKWEHIRKSDDGDGKTLETHRGPIIKEIQNLKKQYEKKENLMSFKTDLGTKQLTLEKKYEEMLEVVAEEYKNSLEKGWERITDSYKLAMRYIKDRNSKINLDYTGNDLGLCVDMLEVEEVVGGTPAEKEERQKLKYKKKYAYENLMKNDDWVDERKE